MDGAERQLLQRGRRRPLGGGGGCGAGDDVTREHERDVADFTDGERELFEARPCHARASGDASGVEPAGRGHVVSGSVAFAFVPKVLDKPSPGRYLFGHLGEGFSSFLP